MERTAEPSVRHISDKDFQAALKLLHKGKIPPNFPEVVAHVQGTIKELMEYSSAITECALRLNNDNTVLRDILEKADVRYEYTPDGPRKTMGGQ